MLRLVKLVLSILGAVWLVDEASARTQVVEGGLSVDYLYVDRENEPPAETETETEAETGTETETAEESSSTESSDEVSENVRQIRVSPLLVYRNYSERDSLEIRYSPSYTYDHELEIEDVDHDLFVSVYRQLNRLWFIRVSNTYSIADYQSLDTSGDTETSESSTTASEESSSESSESNELSEEKFMSNEFELVTEYTYREDSVLSVGYNNNILEHDVDSEEETGTDEETTTRTTSPASDYRDLEVQSAYTSLSYRLMRRWKISGFLQYTEGDYYPAIPVETDEYNPDDGIVYLEESLGEIQLDIDIWPQNLFFIKYGYQRYEFEAYRRDDFVIQEMTLGWEGELTENLSILLSGGPTSVEPDEREEAWGYNAQAELTYRFEGGSLMVSYEKGDEVDMLSSVDEETLSDFYVARVEFAYEPYQDLFLILSGSYRSDLREVVTLDNPETAEIDESESEQYYENQYAAGVRLNYSFARWYTLSLGYRYVNFDSQLAGEDWQESQVYLILEAEKELFRW